MLNRQLNVDKKRMSKSQTIICISALCVGRPFLPFWVEHYTFWRYFCPGLKSFLKVMHGLGRAGRLAWYLAYSVTVLKDFCVL